MTFHEHSKQIVEDYLGTVAYVDDLIFSNNEEDKPKNLGNIDIKIASAKEKDDRELPINKEKVKQESERQSRPNINPLTFTNAFLEKGIHCALLEVTNKNDSLDTIKKTLKKSDVIILDWQMHGDLGKKATEILLSIVKESVNSLRLIAIYSEDKFYRRILSDSIIPRLKEAGIEDGIPDQSGCRYTIEFTKIVVFNKGEKQDDFIVPVVNLPDKLIEELTQMTSGLISNSILQALTHIKQHSHNLLGLYNNYLDPAFLGHSVLLENIKDAQGFFISLLSSSIEDILINSDFDRSLHKNIISNWLDNNIKQKEFDLNIYDENRNGEVISIGKINRDTVFSTKLVESYKKAWNEIEGMTKNDKQNLKEYFEKNSTKYFCNEYSEEIDMKFASLTHNKNIFGFKDSPILSQGTVLKQNETNTYFVCIQQKCDSLRVGNERRFLFLPCKTMKNSGSFDFISPQGEKLKLMCNTYDLKTIKFKPCKKSKKIVAERENSKFVFKSIYFSDDNHKEQYTWSFDLKDSHAQRIVNRFAAELARVGLDESEYLRRS